MTQLRIHLLGQLLIQQGDRPVTELSAKALEMFCYLLLYRDKPHTRDALAAVLWADTPGERAQKYLRQTLWRLQLTYLALLDKLVAYCATQRLYARGIDYAQRILRCDIARESTYQQLMRLHYLAGDRTMALREYARCVQALQREFDLPPMQATVDLYAQIREERLVEAPGVTRGETRGETLQAEREGQRGDLRQQVEQLQGNLAGFQARVHEELKAILYSVSTQKMI